MNELWSVIDAAENLHVDRKRVYDWIKRRSIVPRGRNDRGELLYLESDLLLAERSRRVPARWIRLLSHAQMLGD